MRGWADRREPGPEMNRLYALECALSVTGMNADHRLRIRPSQLLPVALALAATVLASLANNLPASAVAAVALGASAIDADGGEMNQNIWKMKGRQ